jgi:hypothetical protein
LGHSEHPKATQRGGIGPQRALEANSKNPSRTARKPILPRASSASAGPIPRSAITTTHLFNDNHFSAWATIKPSPYRDRTSSKPAAAGPGRSEHWNVDILIPLARQRESLAGPNVPCECRTDPAEPPSRHRSPAPAPALGHRRTGESTRGYAAFLQNAPVVRHTRGFTPGWYAVPRWGTPNIPPPPSLPARIGPVSRSPQKPQRSGIGPMHALEAIKPIPSRTARKPILPRAYLRASDWSRGARFLFLLASLQPSR